MIKNTRMKRIVRLTENDLYKIVKRVIEEQVSDENKAGNFLVNKNPYSFKGLIPFRPNQSAVVQFDSTLENIPQKQVTKQPVSVASIENGIHFFVKDESDNLKSYLSSILLMNLNSLAGKLTINNQPLDQGRPIDELNTNPTFYSISNEFNKLVGDLNTSLGTTKENIPDFIESVPSMKKDELVKVLKAVEDFRKGFQLFKDDLTKKGIQGFDLGKFSSVESYGQAYFGDKVQIFLVLQVNDTGDDQLDVKFEQLRDMIGQQYLEFVKNGVRQNKMVIPSIDSLMKINPRIKNEITKAGVDLFKLDPKIKKLVVIVYSANPGAVDLA